MDALETSVCDEKTTTNPSTLGVERMLTQYTKAKHDLSFRVE